MHRPLPQSPSASPASASGRGGGRGWRRSPRPAPGPHLALVLVLAVTALLAAAAPASAAYQIVKEFRGSGGVESEGSEPGGLAVDETTGDLYEVDGGHARILRFNSTGEGLEAWGWGVADGSPEFERCGPAVAEHPDCRGGLEGQGVAQFKAPTSIAIDQLTGNVFVLNALRSTGVIQEFSEDGGYITAFAEMGEFEEAVAAGPAKIHFAASHNSIAVDSSSGDLYVSDAPAGPAEGEGRVMVFEPTSGARVEYGYAGRSHDLFAGAPYAERSRQIAIDSRGDIFLARETNIFEFAASELSAYEFGAPLVPPTREFNATTAHMEEIEAMSVDPRNGRVFFFSNKARKYHELEPAGGGFTPVGDTPHAPGQQEAIASAFNPALSWEGRPPGTLYSDIPFARNGEGEFLPRTLVAAQPPIFPPSVDAESTTAVGDTFATLQAQIDPRGFATSYRFQYGTAGPCSTNPCAETRASAAKVGSGTEDLSAAAALGGLRPDTTYYFRAIATSHCEPESPTHECEVAGKDRSITTFPTTASGLPDGRAYELVSPPDKHGGQVFALDPTIGSCLVTSCKTAYLGGQMAIGATPGGDAVAYVGTPFSSAGAPNKDEYLSTRTASGWQTTDLSPSLASEPVADRRTGYMSLSEDLSRGLMGQQGFDPALSPDAPAESPNLYLRRSDGSLRPLLTTPTPHGREVRLEVGGTSTDLSHVVFEANDALTAATGLAPEALYGGPEGFNLYDWNAGALQLVNVLPGNAATIPDATLGSGLLLNGDQPATPNFSHAVSDDGSHIFWTDLETGRLYVRIDDERTLEIHDPGTFLTASADGSKVLLSDGCLYVLETGSCRHLDAGSAQAFKGILGAAEDLSRIYFVDSEGMDGAEAGACVEHGNDPEEEREGKIPPGTGCNLYMYEEGRTVFVATLSPHDNQSASTNSGVRDWTASPAKRNAQASPNGQWLAFMSVARLTGYDNEVKPTARGHSQSSEFCTLGLPAADGFGCYQVFLYDAADGSITCASCNPTGEQPLGSSSLPVLESGAKYFPQPHYLTNSGRLFFDSQDSLTASDVNEGVEDAYEYEPAGQGGCQHPGGCTALLSSGHGRFDSNFLAADATGANVFLTTHDSLLAEDGDGLMDVYDAREGGGFPEQAEPPACAGEGCKAAAAPEAAPSSPASASFAGPGNPKAKAEKRHRRKHHRPRRHRRRHKKGASHAKRAAKKRAGSGR